MQWKNTCSAKDLLQDPRETATMQNRCFKRKSPKQGRFLFYPFLSLGLFALLLAGCPLYNPAAFVQHPGLSNGQGPQSVVSTAAQVTITWTPPSSGLSQVASYTVSYRTHGSSAWTTLATVAASAQPSYTVQHTAIGAGSFDFAVASVNPSGATSPLATSLDPTADPSSGWYLTW